ncbi:MAG: thiamine-phosphate kinase [Akkermansiaceae bacterium]
MESLADIGEDDVVARITRDLIQSQNVVVGPGDDCAVIDIGNEKIYQLLKTDCIIEGVHYEANASPERVGWKAVARVVSDFAAMGGVAEHFLITVAMTKDTSVKYIESLYIGMQRCADAFGADICGGETSAIPENSAAMISVAGTGSVAKSQCVTRNGGRAGDAILVTGQLGGSIEGKHLDFTPRINEAGWLTGNYDIHAMMDLSDGVGRDLPRLAAASGCEYQISLEDLPTTPGCDYAKALGDGEDYELMFALNQTDIDDLMSDWPKNFPDLPLTKIGNLCEMGQGDELENTGWQHFNS